ncbi:MAG: lytic transglycosylase domain-containing protein [Azospirillaceae bacterium]|nr:lytic transglycosylase domain-containing protein [Azospirillaceae bacterium]
MNRQLLLPTPWRATGILAIQHIANDNQATARLLLVADGNRPLRQRLLDDTTLVVGPAGTEPIVGGGDTKTTPRATGPITTPWATGPIATTARLASNVVFLSDRVPGAATAPGTDADPAPPPGPARERNPAMGNDEPHHGVTAISAAGDDPFSPQPAPLAIAPVEPPHFEVRPDTAGHAASANTALSRNDDNAPMLLAEEDASRYHRIFELQNRGDIESADREIPAIKNSSLIGYVLMQRYLATTGYKASADELQAWLSHYRDLAGAERVYALAIRQLPPGARKPPEPVAADDFLDDGYSFDPRLDVRPARQQSRGAHQSTAIATAVRLIDAVLQRDGVGAGVRMLAPPLNPNLSDQTAYDTARVEVAAALLYHGQAHQALAFARASAERSGTVLPRAHWITGLAYWYLDNAEAAGHHFQIAAENPDQGAWESAAAAYWAARALDRPPHHNANARTWLERAARFPRTFYGLLATQSLGETPRFRWELPALTDRELSIVTRMPAGQRAVHLIQIGQRDLAERELRRLHPAGNPALEQAILTLADIGKMPRLSLRLGGAMTDPDGTPYDAALFPLPPWAPREDANTDPALLFALMRQESRFEPNARSESGALGLMQLIPSTAFSVGNGRGRAGGTSSDLLDPETNVTLGQRYIAYLAQQPQIANNMVMMLAAYNAGPGNLSYWLKDVIRTRDPLLFIEILPAWETRGFVQLVLTNYWMYCQRLGQETPTLADLARNRWPVYKPTTVTASTPDGTLLHITSLQDDVERVQVAVHDR